MNLKTCMCMHFQKLRNHPVSFVTDLLELFAELFPSSGWKICFGNRVLLFIRGVSNYVFMNKNIYLQEMRHIWRTLRGAMCKREA